MDKHRVRAIFAVTAVLAVYLLLSPHVFRVAEELTVSLARLVPAENELSVYEEWATPSAGEQVLPDTVSQMISLLRENDVSTYRFSRTISRKERLKQRLIEGAFPIRFVRSAPHRLSVTGEHVPSSCKILSRSQEVILAHCP